jgi:hypothetical protein
MTENEFLASVGGRQVVMGTGDPSQWNFGWLSFAGNPDETFAKQRSDYLSSLPEFKISGSWQMDQRRYPLWKFGVQVTGKFLPYFNQVTGSCVGAGGGNMLMTAICTEIAQGQAEEFRIPWWPYTYGQSRVRAGMTGRGEGSTGAAWSEAATEDGTFGIHEQTGLPQFSDAGQGWLKLTSTVELQWSEGKYGDQFDPLAAKHLFKTVARMRNADDCLAALVNGYPITQASNFGFSPMVPSPQSDPPVRLVSWNGSWSHQTYIDEVWDHPKLGIIFRWGNNWGPTAHGPALGDEPPSSVYITAATLTKICQQGEVYDFSAFDGFPARTLNWIP